MEILIPVLAVTVIGILCGVMLVVASKFMAVKEDETFIAVRACLPGANCGACGYAGCDGYAKALASGETDAANLCIPGAAATAKEVAAVLGLEVQDSEAKMAYVACCGENTYMSMKHDYRGIQTCVAANMLYSGYGKCYHSCLGIGDCAEVCPNKAICVENGIAIVKPELCVGCGLCAKICPNQLIHIIPATAKAIVRCSNQDKGVNTRKNCAHGCIGCKKCEKACPEGAVKVENNCACIDYSKCVNCGKCIEVCATGCIMEADFRVKA